MKMKAAISIAVFIVALATWTIAQNKSVYTSTKTNACRTIESTDEGAGSYIGECAGVGGYKIQVLEGDIRQSINIITPARKKFELNFWNIFGAFSAVGEKVEWRTKAGAPVALIVRYNVADISGTGKGKSYLLVSKVSRKSACVTDVVEGGPNQNVKARELADTSASKPCKTTE